MLLGNMPKDGGNFIFTESEWKDALKDNPEIAYFKRYFYGSQELIRGFRRYCLWIEDDEIELATKSQFIANRLDGVKQMRLASSAKSTRDYAKYSHRFKQIQGVAMKT